MTTAIDELLLSAAEVEIQATEKPTTVCIVAYTGGLMTVPDWGPVAINLAGVDASAEQISLLADHDASLKGIVGHGRAVVANGKLLVQGTISPRLSTPPIAGCRILKTTIAPVVRDGIVHAASTAAAFFKSGDARSNPIPFRRINTACSSGTRSFCWRVRSSVIRRCFGRCCRIEAGQRGSLPR